MLLVGLLIFGRRLPEVGRTLGKTIAQLRRGLQDFRAQLDKDESLREVGGAVRELKKLAEAPRVLANPTRWFESPPPPPDSPPSDSPGTTTPPPG